MTDPKELWPIEPLSDATTARMINRALAAPQLLPWPQALGAAVERALSDWRYAMPYKLAAAAACVALGLGIGLNVQPHDVDAAGVAFSSTVGGEVSE